MLILLDKYPYRMGLPIPHSNDIICKTINIKPDRCNNDYGHSTIAMWSRFCPFTKILEGLCHNEGLGVSESDITIDPRLPS